MAEDDDAADGKRNHCGRTPTDVADLTAGVPFQMVCKGDGASGIAVLLTRLADNLDFDEVDIHVKDTGIFIYLFIYFLFFRHTV